MSLIDVVKYQGKTISDDQDYSQNEQSTRFKELEQFTIDSINADYPELFLNSVFDKEVQEEGKEKVEYYVRQWIKINGSLKEYKSVEDTTKAISDNIIGLGILEPLLDIKGITDIFSDGLDDIYYYANGNDIQTDLKFDSEESMFKLMKKLAIAAKDPLTPANPAVNAQIGKNRFNVVLGKIRGGLADNHRISIRVHRVENFTPAELIEAGQITEEGAEFLADVAKSKEIAGMFFGPTGSGKSTSLNALIISNIPDDERTFVIQDEDELKSKERYPKKRITELYTKVGKTADSTFYISRLIEDIALRAMPDRVLVGEIRKGVDGDKYLYALSTGHKGWSSGHSDRARGSLGRIVKMVQEVKPRADKSDIVDDIYSLIDIIVYVKIIKDGGKKVRKITDIVELYQDDDGKNEYRYIFKHRKSEGLKRVGTISEALAIKLEDQGIDPTRWLELEGVN